MEFLKELFGEDGIKYDEFVTKVNEKGYKIVDISKGGYVDKKKYDDEVAAHNASKTSYTDLEKKYNNLQDSIKSGDDSFQKKYDDLLNNYNTLKTEKETVDKQNDDYKKKDIIRGAGITNDRLVNLALYELKDSQNFENDIKDWAKNNKSLMTNVKTMPKMSGNPDEDKSEDDKFFDAFYKSAGIEKKDVVVKDNQE